MFGRLAVIAVQLLSIFEDRPRRSRRNPVRFSPSREASGSLGLQFQIICNAVQKQLEFLDAEWFGSSHHHAILHRLHSRLNGSKSGHQPPQLPPDGVP